MTDTHTPTRSTRRGLLRGVIFTGSTSTLALIPAALQALEGKQRSGRKA